MDHTFGVPCPNCGHPAVRRHFSSGLKSKQWPGKQIIQTECFHCDYLMVVCSASGSVIEGYAPGISSTNHHGLDRRLSGLISQST